MPKGNKSDKIAQKKNNYQVINEPNKDGPEKIPTCACDRKRCLNGRCGSCWMVILGMSIALAVFLCLYMAGVLGFDFSTSGTETLYEVISDTTSEPTVSPTLDPTEDPTLSPSYAPTVEPTYSPTAPPTITPSASPSETPTELPSAGPTTAEPTMTPTADPTDLPTGDPTSDPTGSPTTLPTKLPTTEPTLLPTADPTTKPTSAPTSDPTTSEPTNDPTSNPTATPTDQPTHDPTTDPTADPTSERRRSFDMNLNSNILFLIVDGNLFNYTEFETPAVDQFLKEGYTLNGSASGSLVAGKIFRSGLFHNQGLSSWAELLRLKGYSNYYYGSWMAGSEDKVSTPEKQGWDFFDEDVIMEKVQSRLQTIKDEKWFIAVNWTISDKDIGLMVNGSKASFDRCTRYFKFPGAELNYHHGLSCHCTIGYDAIFGEVRETLESTRQWMKTLVVFVVAGQQKNIFSMGGGALPSSNNKDRYLTSTQDVVRKILSVSGFSDLELRSLRMDGSPVFGMKQ